MATATAYDVSDAFLRALGAPTTPAMRRAVAIWLRFESGGMIVGNNPWNLHSGAVCPKSAGYCPGQGSLPGQIGNRYAGPGDQNVAVFATLDDGAKASANNLTRLAPSYGYGKVIAAARAGDALGFLNALQQSSWSAGHYNFSKLTSAFGGSFNYNTQLTLRTPAGGVGPVPTSSIGSGQLATAGAEKQLADIFKSLGLTDPNHVITADEAQKIAAALGSPRNTQLMAAYKGKTVGEMLKTAAADIPIVGGIIDAAGLAAGVGAFLFDTDNWKYMAAIALGVPMTLLGFYLLAGVPTGGANA